MEEMERRLMFGVLYGICFEDVRRCYFVYFGCICLYLIKVDLFMGMLEKGFLKYYI